MRTRLVGASVLAMAVAQAAPGGAAAQTPPQAGSPNKGAIEEVVVTSQKRSEKLQRVPESIQVLDSKKLSQLNITDFQDYVKYVPSLAYQTEGPNETTIYLRGVVDGGNANHSGPLPTVGTYLDEMPTTTIGGTLDVHLYDMARIEVLPGPQGTLYGASSESGTVRFITNQPTTSKMEAGYNVEVNDVDHGSLGSVAEGFVNYPINDKVAVRLVAFDEHDSGYIDNVYGTRPFATSGATINNRSLVASDFNPADTFGGRAAALVDINDDWSITPQVMGQDQRNTGTFGYEPSVGNLEVQRFQPDTFHDRWIQAAMNVTGHIGDYTLNYSGGFFVRDEVTRTDYTDYSVFYDQIYGSGAFWQDKNGNPLLAPQQSILGKDHFTKESNEIRLTSPADGPVHFIVGAFQEDQGHRIIQDYQIPGFDPALSIPGWPNTIWLTNQQRTDRDLAAFTEVVWDVTDKFSILGGVRPYYYDNSLVGFFGFSQAYDELTGYSSGEGANRQNCIAKQHFDEAPCVDLNKSVTGSGETHKINLTYKIDGERLVYFTYSTGYRPGGVNRRSDQGAYQADTLTNFELGFKSTWLDRHLVFNTALYDEDWSQFQFAYLGQNSFTIIKNAPNANIKGIEAEVQYIPLRGLTLSSGITLTHAELTQDFCTDANGNVVTDCAVNGVPLSLAPKGTALPYTPAVKGYGTARYVFPISDDWNGHVQGAISYQSRNHVGLRESDNIALGSMPAYETVDFSAGAERGNLQLELFVKNLFNSNGEENRLTPCTIEICAANIQGIPRAIYVVPVQPLTVGIRVSQKF